MAETVKEAEKQNLHDADEVRTTERMRVEVVRLAGTTVMRGTFEPGWRWSEHVKPVAGTESCEVKHVGYVISGRMHIRMDSGEELLLEPGDFASVEPGHDAWVEGDEPFVVLDIYSGEVYGKGAATEVRRAA
jgi:quercetin dioxygenase-like cupin family protein